MPPKKRQCRISAEEAVNNILNFIENDEVVSDDDTDDELGDLGELCGDQGKLHVRVVIKPIYVKHNSFFCNK